MVLTSLAKQPLITAVAISAEIGITERAVRKIISELEKHGYIGKSKGGRRIRYTIDPEVPLRHKTQRDKAVGGLLKILGWKGKRQRVKHVTGIF
jgi:DNA-binding transcriptional regulator PaaX